jgi:molecular chaperone DnaK
VDLTSGRTARAELHRTSGLTPEQIAAEAEWVRSLRIQ